MQEQFYNYHSTAFISLLLRSLQGIWYSLITCTVYFTRWFYACVLCWLALSVGFCVRKCGCSRGCCTEWFSSAVWACRLCTQAANGLSRRMREIWHSLNVRCSWEWRINVCDISLRVMTSVVGMRWEWGVGKYLRPTFLLLGEENSS